MIYHQLLPSSVPVCSPVPVELRLALSLINTFIWNEDNLKNENNLKPEDNFKNEDNLKNQDDFKNE